MATDKGQSIALLARIVILEDKRRFQVGCLMQVQTQHSVYLKTSFISG